MIQDVIQYIARGFTVLRYNTNYLLVAGLVFLLPALFFWVTHVSFDTAYQNITTTRKQSIDTLHDALSLVVMTQSNQAEIGSYLTELVAVEPSVSAAKILLEQNNELLITYSSNPDEVGLVEGASQLFLSTGADTADSLIFDITQGNEKIWRAYRKISSDEGALYLMTDHSFARTDAVIVARQQQAYLGLSIVLLFLIALAYWLTRQTNWQKKHAQLKERLDEQMMFTNSVAHELRAPLTAVRGYVSFLRESKNLTHEERGFADNINTSTVRLIALINDFLEVARIQSGNLKLTFKEVDIRPVLRSVHTEFVTQAEEKGLDLQLIMPPQPILAETDTDRLQQVVTNLLSNAIKYTDTGSVTIELTQTRLRTVIAIKDTGHGISAEDQTKLFGAFTRVGQADTSKTVGTGLGMWITKQLVTLLHGTIYVESIEGVGTHIKLTFDV